MCATPNEKALFAIRKRTKSFTAWKLVYIDGKSFHSQFPPFQYQPGWNYAKKGWGPNYQEIKDDHMYDDSYPSGIHVYAKKQTPPKGETCAVVPVTVNPKDVFVAESKDVQILRQLVCTKVFVNQAKWEKAGVKFPKSAKISLDIDPQKS